MTREKIRGKINGYISCHVPWGIRESRHKFENYYFYYNELHNFSTHFVAAAPPNGNSIHITKWNKKKICENNSRKIKIFHFYVRIFFFAFSLSLSCSNNFTCNVLHTLVYFIHKSEFISSVFRGNVATVIFLGEARERVGEQQSLIEILDTHCQNI